MTATGGQAHGSLGRILEERTALLHPGARNTQLRQLRSLACIACLWFDLARHTEAMPSPANAILAGALAGFPEETTVPLAPLPREVFGRRERRKNPRQESARGPRGCGKRRGG